MKIMIAGAWDETNENLLSSAFQIAKVAAEKKHIIITGGGTGIPNSATHGALAVNGISIAYSNEGHCEGGHEPATLTIYQVSPDIHFRVCLLSRGHMLFSYWHHIFSVP